MITLISKATLVRFSLALTLSVFGLQAYAAKYLITVKDAKTFQSIEKSAAEASQGNGAVNFMSASSKLESSLKHLNMFVVESDEDITFLQENPSILAVEKDVLFPAPQFVSTKSSCDCSSDDSDFDQPWGIDAVGAPSAWSTSTGTDIKVLVIDSGVDKDHPALEDRLIEGKNFMSRSSGKNVPYEYFDDIGHGTHVAGTVLGGNTIGVAPDAELYVGRVCGARGCSPTAIASAVNWGIENEVDVMNLSLGGARISASERRAFAKAEEMGITVVAAAGNSGADSISFPSKVDTIIAVGALDENLDKAEFSQYGDGLFIMAPGVNVFSAVPLGTGRKAVTKINLGDGFEEVESNSFVGASALDEAVEKEMVYVGLGKKADYKGVNLAGKIALIKRGEITFADKVKGAIKAGAAAAIIFNNESGLAGGTITEDGSEIGIPVVMIEQSLGKNILKKINTKTFAPKANVFISKTNYGSQQGTSMASPHVAGCVALILGANPNLSPKQVRDIIATTASDMGDIFENGHGLIDVDAAVTKALTIVGDKVMSSATLASVN